MAGDVTVRIVESSDGSVKVVELDPTKWYWIVIDSESGIDPFGIKRVDGLILIKNPGSEVTFVENADRVEGPADAKG